MFTHLDNKYVKTYFAIMNRAQLRPVPFTHWRKRNQNDQYYEAHHIHPRSLGGADDETNIAYLTAKEHFVAHLLLTKMLEGEDLRKMQYALSKMLIIPKKMQGLRYTPTGRTFEIARLAAANAMRGNEEVASKISAAHTGKTLTEEHKKKISEGMKGKVKPPEAAKASGDKQRGKPKSEESKEKMRLAWIARRERIAAGLETRKPMSEQAKKNISDAAKGKSLTPEHRAKISAGLKKKV